MSSVIDSIERAQLRKGLPSFDAGRSRARPLPGDRGQPPPDPGLRGVVLKRQGSGARETFTVRKQSFGVGVERTFPLHSPKIEKLEVAARGDVRRAKLYYLRGRVGKAARVAERRWGIDEDVISAPADGRGAGGGRRRGRRRQERGRAERGRATPEARGEPRGRGAEAEEAEAEAEAPRQSRRRRRGRGSGRRRGGRGARGRGDRGQPQRREDAEDEEPAERRRLRRGLGS